MDVVYHAGMHKTATTLVQKWLATHRDALRAQGIWVFIPEDLVGFRRLSRDALVARLSEMVETVHRAGGQRTIFSNEGFTALDGQQFALLARAVPNVRTSCILTIRHWNSYLPSRWQQNAKRVDSQSFGKMISRLRDPESVSINLRFDLLVQRILEARFDDCAFISYDRAVKDGGILQAVLQAAGVPPLVGEMAKSSRVNESMDTLTTDIVRLFNGIRSGAEGRRQNPLHDAREDPSIRPHFFDHNPHRVITLMRSCCPEIVSRLSDVQLTLLRAADFQPVAERVEAMVAPFIVNPTGGRLFPDIPDREVFSSPLEVEDLPPAVIEKVLLAAGTA